MPSMAKKPTASLLPLLVICKLLSASIKNNALDLIQGVFHGVLSFSIDCTRPAWELNLAYTSWNFLGYVDVYEIWV